MTEQGTSAWEMAQPGTGRHTLGSASLSQPGPSWSAGACWCPLRCPAAPVACNNTRLTMSFQVPRPNLVAKEISQDASSRNTLTVRHPLLTSLSPAATDSARLRGQQALRCQPGHPGLAVQLLAGSPDQSGNPFGRWGRSQGLLLPLAGEERLRVLSRLNQAPRLH